MKSSDHSKTDDVNKSGNNNPQIRYRSLSEKVVETGFLVATWLALVSIPCRSIEMQTLSFWKSLKFVDWISYIVIFHTISAVFRLCTIATNVCLSVFLH